MKPSSTPNRLLRIREVMNRTGLSRSVLYSLAAAGDFPHPVKLSQRCSAWPEQAIDDWIAERIAAAEQERAA